MAKARRDTSDRHTDGACRSRWLRYRVCLSLGPSRFSPENRNEGERKEEEEKEKEEEKEEARSTPSQVRGLVRLKLCLHRLRLRLVLRVLRVV